jgi:hypothetical protein
MQPIRRVTVLLVASALAGCNPIAAVRDQADRQTSANNLKQLGIAIQGYRDSNGKLPPVEAAQVGPVKWDVSWRVHVLPYIEQDNVYKMLWAQSQARGAVAWNDPLLQSTRIKLYELPGEGRNPAPPGHTYYRALVGPGAAFDPADPAGREYHRKLAIVEAAPAVPWARPEELAYAPNQPLPPLGGTWEGGFLGVYGDSEVRWFPKNTDEATLRAAITGTYGGERPGEKVGR